MADKKYEVEKQEVQTPERVERTHYRRTFVPRVDIAEGKDEILLAADVPGAGEKDVDITLEKNILTLHVEIPESKEEAHSLAYAEYETGDYERSFTLSDEIDRDGIEASVKDGVLRIRLPKAEPAKERKIAVKAG